MQRLSSECRSLPAQFPYSWKQTQAEKFADENGYIFESIGNLGEDTPTPTPTPDPTDKPTKTPKPNDPTEDPTETPEPGMHPLQW